MISTTDKIEAIARILDVLYTLRTHCPWDKEQTMESLRANTIEEVYELSDAILAQDISNLSKELGDVLLHVLFYARIAEEKGYFDLSDVCNRLCNKLIYRHPHIYGTTVADNALEVEQSWERIKQKEKDGNKTVLSGVPVSLPSVVKAYRIQDKARAVGFDWNRREDVWQKVKEEIAELEVELNAGSLSEQRIEEEFGDLFFSLINAARLYGVNPDNALELTNKKFITRFNYVEQQALAQGKAVAEYSIGELDFWWNEAKKNVAKKHNIKDANEIKMNQ